MQADADADGDGENGESRLCGFEQEGFKREAIELLVMNPVRNPAEAMPAESQSMLSDLGLLDALAPKCQSEQPPDELAHQRMTWRLKRVLSAMGYRWVFGRGVLI